MPISTERNHAAVGTETITIGPADVAWHDRFFHHAAETFGIDFSRRAGLGGWQENYRVVAAVEGCELVSTVGVTQVKLALAHDEADATNGRLIDGIQLGAVATRGDRHGEGFARRLIYGVLADADVSGMPVMLFANPSVMDFYPKFGFRRLEAQQAFAKMDTVPGGDGARCLNLTRESDLALLRQLCASSPIHGGILATPADPSTLLWYLCNGFTSAYVVQEESSIVFVDETEDCLVLQEWLGAPPADLVTVLSSVVKKPVSVVEFGFIAPQSWSHGPLRIETDPDAFMFWRGPELPAGDLCFPTLMRT